MIWTEIQDANWPWATLNTSTDTQGQYQGDRVGKNRQSAPPWPALSAGAQLDSGETEWNYPDSYPAIITAPSPIRPEPSSAALSAPPVLTVCHWSTKIERVKWLKLRHVSTHIEKSHFAFLQRFQVQLQIIFPVSILSVRNQLSSGHIFLSAVLCINTKQQKHYSGGKIQKQRKMRNSTHMMSTYGGENWLYSVMSLLSRSVSSGIQDNRDKRFAI